MYSSIKKNSTALKLTTLIAVEDLNENLIKQYGDTKCPVLVLPDDQR